MSGFCDVALRLSATCLGDTALSLPSKPIHIEDESRAISGNLTLCLVGTPDSGDETACFSSIADNDLFVAQSVKKQQGIKEDLRRIDRRRYLAIVRQHESSAGSWPAYRLC